MRYILKMITEWVVGLILLFIFSPGSFPQSYLVQRYSETEGLPSASVYDITQDQQGRMWFATRSGIAVYDGVSWEKFTVAEGLPVLSFAKITADAGGRIWALGNSGQGGIFVAYYDGRRWNFLKGPENNNFYFSFLTSFALLDREEKTALPTLAVGTSDQGLEVWDQGKWNLLNEAHGLLSPSVNGIVALEGKFYAATNKGLSVITRDLQVDNGLNRRLGLISQPIKGIAVQYRDRFPDSPLKTSRVWLYGKNWLGYFEAKNTELIRYTAGLALSGKDSVVKILPDYRGGVYAGDHYILEYFNYLTGAWEFLDTPNGLIGAGTNSLFIDFEKNIWVTCDRGVSKISSRRFSNFQRYHGLLEDEVASILEYEPGKFVLGHNFGVTFYDGKEFLPVPFSLEGESKSKVGITRVLEMQRDSQGNIWLAASWAGLAKIDPRRPRQITWYRGIPGLPEKITCLRIDNLTGNLWLGTEGGIFLLTRNPASNPSKPGTEFISTEIPGLPGSDYRRIDGESGKLLFIGSNANGVYIYDQAKKRWRNYQVPGDSKANAVYAIEKDRRGRLFIGTLAGLYQWENHALEKFKAGDFQVDRPVYCIAADHKNRLWVGTDNGVVRWDGKKATVYSIGEGLIGQETNRAALTIDTGGRVWIGTNRGVSVYDEQFDTSESYNPPPKIRLLSLQVGEQQIPLRENYPLRLAYQDNTLVFHFRGISFSDEAALRFKYKLEGYQEKWSQEEYPYRQMVQYVKLPPGSYRFHIKARNALGAWSAAVISPEITIMPPFYRTWWFLALLVILVGGVFYGLFRFITQKQYAIRLEKQVEERTRQLQAVEKRYQDLFEESKDVVFMTTPEGKLVDINPAGLELFGAATKEEALNIKSITDIYYFPADRAVFNQEIEKHGYVKDYELIFKNKDGEPITVQVTATLVRDHEKRIIGFRGILRDISRQKKLEEQLIQAQKMEAIGTLAGGIAHDFNNILAAIMGNTELAMDDLPEGSLARQNVENILTGAERAAELVRQILAFSRHSEQKRKPLILSNIIKEALKLLRSSLPATIEIRQDIRAESGVILGNPTQVHQVMMNLGANAGHAMQEKGGILEVSLDEVLLDEETTASQDNLKPGPYLKLVVSDTGHGIPQALMKRIFEPYFTTKKTGEGTGMGLAVIHGIIKSHGGTIFVYSEPGQGAVFSVFFPKIETPVKSEESSNAEPPGGTERILLVEDEESLQVAGTQLLQRMGYQVVGISDPLEALKLFQTDPYRFDLIISDITMPHLTGDQLTREVKSLRPNIPVILCSGYSSMVTAEQAKNLGASAFAMKPMNRTEMAQVIRKVLDGRE